MKQRPEQDLTHNLLCQCCALSVDLLGQLGAGGYVGQSLALSEAAWPSGYGAGLEIWRSRVEIPL